MGEGCKDALRLNFDRKLKLEFHGTKVTSDAGLLAYRELDEVLGLTEPSCFEISDSRTGRNTQHSIAALLRHEDTNDPSVCVLILRCVRLPVAEPLNTGQLQRARWVALRPRSWLNRRTLSF